MLDIHTHIHMHTHTNTTQSQEDSDQGREIKKCVEAGLYVPAEVVTSLVIERLGEQVCVNAYVYIYIYIYKVRRSRLICAC